MILQLCSEMVIMCLHWYKQNVKVVWKWKKKYKPRNENQRTRSARSWIGTFCAHHPFERKKFYTIWLHQPGRPWHVPDPSGAREYNCVPWLEATQTKTEGCWGAHSWWHFRRGQGPSRPLFRSQWILWRNIEDLNIFLQYPSKTPQLHS